MYMSVWGKGTRWKGEISVCVRVCGCACGEGGGREVGGTVVHCEITEECTYV